MAKRGASKSARSTSAKRAKTDGGLSLWAQAKKNVGAPMILRKDSPLYPAAKAEHEVLLLRIGIVPGRKRYAATPKRKQSKKASTKASKKGSKKSKRKSTGKKSDWIKFVQSKGYMQKGQPFKPLPKKNSAEWKAVGLDEYKPKKK